MRDKPRRKRYLDDLLAVDMINSPDIAARLGELLIDNHFGSKHPEAQRPLTVVDQDDQWVVRGSRNKALGAEGLGPAKIIIRKKDGQILDMHIPYNMIPHPDVKEIVEKARKANQPPE